MNRNISLTITLSQSEFVYLITQSPATFHFYSPQSWSYGIPKNWDIFLRIFSPFLRPCMTYHRYCFVIPNSFAKSTNLTPLSTRSDLMSLAFVLYLGFLMFLFLTIMGILYFIFETCQEGYLKFFISNMKGLSKWKKYMKG